MPSTLYHTIFVIIFLLGMVIIDADHIEIKNLKTSINNCTKCLLKIPNEGKGIPEMKRGILHNKNLYIGMLTFVIGWGLHLKMDGIL